LIAALGKIRAAKITASDAVNKRTVGYGGILNQFATRNLLLSLSVKEF